MTRLTQIPVEVAIQRDFTSNARLTQIPVEVAILPPKARVTQEVVEVVVKRGFTTNTRVTQYPIEVAVKYAYPKNIDEYTKLLIHGDGENNSKLVLDEKRNIIGVFGDTVISTDCSKFGGSSIRFPGNSSYIKSMAGLYINNNKFTIDGWVRLDNINRLNVIASYGGSNSGFIVSVSSNNKLTLYSSENQIVDAENIVKEEFFHFALVGNGAADGQRNIKLYKNGNLIGTWTTNYNWAKNLIFGANEADDNECLLGYLDELRLSIGIERWTENFIPPKKPYGMKEYKVNKGLSFSSFGYGNRNIFGYY